MPMDILIGRNQADREKYGMAGTILIGKAFVTMGQTTALSNPIYLEIAKAHVVFICGKRGGGKSYTMGVIAEGLIDLPTEVKQNLSIIMLDTMGVYWTMKYPNKKEEPLLEQWGFKGKGLDIKIFTPKEYYHKYKEQGIPTDYPFSVKPSELTSDDWCMTFDVSANHPIGVALQRLVYELRKSNPNYDIDDMIEAIKNDTRSEKVVKDAIENHFLGTKSWGVFDKEGTPLKELAMGGQVTVLDVSCYATMPGGWKIKALIIGLISQKLFIERMKARKEEEFGMINQSMHYFATDEPEATQNKMPLVWLVIDEAHEFLPLKGKNPATDPLVTIMREGRQPGISLILATQQPGKIHTDVMTQSDIVISHRITAKMDVDALGLLMQSYMRSGLTEALDKMPRVKGAAIVFDDTNERMYPMRIRPRFTWHGGEAPIGVKPQKKTFGL